MDGRCGDEARRKLRRRAVLAPAIEALERRTLLASSIWAFPGADGRMLYQPQPLGDHIEDYSNSGFKGGTTPIPTVPVKVVVPAPTPGVDQTAAIQNAINSVSAMPMDSSGFRGAVLLSAGTYDVATTINITTSGVVLRGSGQSLSGGGTVIHATGVGERTIINVNGSGTRTTVAGTTHTITDQYVPVGAYSFTVDSTAGLAVGDSVIVHRPSTQAWINALGMNLLDMPWTPGSKDINMDRTITHIDGNVITVDGPVTQALDVQYTDSSQGNNTIYKYTANGRLTNVGVENLAGYSDFDHSITSTEGASSSYFADEDHPWIFINVDGSQNAWVRNVSSEFFGYACVTVTGNSKYVTVQDSECLDPVSIITGGRRYSFDVDDSDYILFRNLYTREGRHDYVEGSTVTGPNVFVDDRADAEHADAGPHHRYSTAALWDNLNVGQLNIQNRGNLGTGHGWAGANQVIWNSTSSGGFVVQNPPTAQNWLIGGVGKINNGTVFVGPHDPGIYDSTGPSGPNVTPRSLYYQQLSERMSGEDFVPREVRLGDADNYVAGNPADTPPVDAAWKTAVQNVTGKTAAGFDSVANNQVIPFTFNFALDPGTQVIGANLSIGFKSAGGDTSGDKIYIENTSRVYSWSQLGVSAPGTAADSAVIDLSSLLAALQDGKFNIAVSGNTAIDWVTLNLQTASTTQPTTTTLTAAADAYVQDGNSSNTNFGTATTLQTKLDTTGNNRQTYLKFDLSSLSGYVTSATLRLVSTSVGVSPDTFGSGTGAIFNDISLVSDNTWSETGITWSNKPAGSTSFDEFLSSLNAPLNIDVTSLVQNALTQTDKRLSFQVLSTVLNSLGQISYASRENSSVSLRPVLIINSYNAVGANADAYVRDGSSSNSNFGTATDLETKKDTSANSGNNREAYLQFNLAGQTTAPAGATIRLVPIQPDATTPGATNSAAFVSTDSWTETGITWNNKPASSTVLGTWTPTQGAADYFDVTSQVSAAIASGTDKLVSVRVFSNTTSSGITTYASREYADPSLRPLLILKNLAPRITGIANISTNAGAATAALWFGISDAETAASALSVSATSSNTTLLPNANITLGGSGMDRTFMLTPVAGKTGTANVTLTVTDAQGATASTTFTLSVSNSIQFNGDQDLSGEADVIRVVRNGAFLDIYRNNTVVPALHTDYTNAGPIAINGLAGSDTITVDYSLGNPIPAGGLTIDAGDGTGDVLNIVGSSAADAISLAAGTITVNGAALSYSNVEEMDLSPGAGADVLAAAGNAAVSVSLFKLLMGAGETLSMGTASTLPDFTDLSVPAGATFNLNGQSQVIDALDGMGTVLNNSSASSTLTIGEHDGGGSFGGTLSSGTGALALTKAGAGTEILSGANSYTGATNINAGALRITNNAALGSTSGTTTISGGTDTGRLELAGGITVAEPITLANRTGGGGGNFAPHILNMAGNNTLSGAITLSSGGSYWTLQSDVGKLTISGNLTNNVTSNTRTLYLRGAGSGEITGQLRQTNISLTQVNKEDSGTWQITGLANYTGPTNVDAGTLIVTAAGASSGSAVTVSNGATYRMTGSAAAFKIAGLSLGASTSAIIDLSGASTLTTPTLTIAPGATLDINDNGVIVDYAGGSSPLATIAGYLAAAFNAGAWNKAGIASSVANRDTSRRHGIGYLDTAVLNVGSFMGQSANPTSVLVRYTRYGDNNLDGTVDVGNDFGLLLDGLSATNASSWVNGDYTYDGKVDLGNDFNLFEVGFLGSQHAPGLTAPAAIKVAAPPVVSGLEVKPLKDDGDDLASLLE